MCYSIFYLEMDIQLYKPYRCSQPKYTVEALYQDLLLKLSLTSLIILFIFGFLFGVYVFVGSFYVDNVICIQRHVHFVFKVYNYNKVIEK